VVGALSVRALRLPVAWFLAALVPTLFVQAVIPLNILVADRFLLFALPALAALVAHGVTACPRALLPAAVAALLLLVPTETTLPVWKSDEALWTATAERLPGHWRANVWLGQAAWERRDLDRALEHLFAAEKAQPQSGLTRFRLGQALEERGIRSGDGIDLERARAAYVVAIHNFALPRQEGAASFLPIAQIALVDTTLGLGQVDQAVKMTGSLLATTPTVPPIARQEWARRRDLLAQHLEKYVDPRREPSEALAPRLRQWTPNP
jgi:tetratricopeptide (TPR) repeat protein